MIIDRDRHLNCRNLKQLVLTCDFEAMAAFALGLDVPISTIRHVTLSPLVRVYIVNHTPVDSGWSMRLALGVNAGVKW